MSVGAWGERAGLGGPSALIEGSIKRIIRGQGEGIPRREDSVARVCIDSAYFIYANHLIQLLLYLHPAALYPAPFLKSPTLPAGPPLRGLLAPHISSSPVPRSSPPLGGAFAGTFLTEIIPDFHAIAESFNEVWKKCFPENSRPNTFSHLFPVLDHDWARRVYKKASGSGHWECFEACKLDLIGICDRCIEMNEMAEAQSYLSSVCAVKFTPLTIAKLAQFFRLVSSLKINNFELALLCHTCNVTDGALVRETSFPHNVGTGRRRLLRSAGNDALPTKHTDQHPSILHDSLSDALPAPFSHRDLSLPPARGSLSGLNPLQRHHPTTARAFDSYNFRRHPEPAIGIFRP